MVAQSIPSFNSCQEKEAWIKANPEEYKQLLNSSAVVAPANTSLETAVSQPSEQIVHVSGFPAYVNTGNKQKDDENYMEAKKAWIAAHPEEYKQMTQSPK